MSLVKSPTFAWCALATSCSLTLVLVAGVASREAREEREARNAPGLASAGPGAGRSSGGAPRSGGASGAGPDEEERGPRRRRRAGDGENATHAGAVDATDPGDAEAVPGGTAAETGPVPGELAADEPEGAEPVEDESIADESTDEPIADEPVAVELLAHASLEAALGAGAPTYEALVGSIAKLGPEHVPELVAVLCGDPDVAMASEGETLDGAADAAAVEGREGRDRAIREALRSMDPDARLRAIVARAKDAPIDVRRVLVELLGELDHARALETLVATVLPIDPIELRRGYVAGPIESAFSARLAAHPEGALELRRSLDKAPKELVALVARSCTRVPTTASGALIGSLVGRDKSLDLELFSALARMQGQARLVLPGPAIDALRRALSHTDPEHRRAAAAALGAVRDDDSIPMLVERLSDPDGRVASAARWSLRAISRIDRGERPEPWQEWLAEQSAWRADERPRLVALLDADLPDDVAKGIEGLIARPCFRSEAVPLIEPLLRHEHDGVFLATVAALESIGTAEALDALDAVPMRPEERRFAAAAAVRRVFGLEIEVEAKPRRRPAR